MLQVPEIEENEDAGEGEGHSSNEHGNEVDQEVKYCSKVHFRVPDIIEL